MEQITTSFTPYKEKAGETYMNQAQLAHFKAILLCWKKELVAEASQTLQHLQEEVGNAADPLDQAAQTEEFTIELRARDRGRKLVKKIEDSIEQIETGSYGYCRDCEAEIGIRRLEARPTAVLCIDCKTIAEKKEARG